MLFSFCFSDSSRHSRFTTQMEELADDEGSSISFSPVRAPMPQHAQVSICSTYLLNSSPETGEQATAAGHEEEHQT
jgi:hypothetical protein